MHFELNSTDGAIKLRFSSIVFVYFYGVMNRFVKTVALCRELFRRYAYQYVTSIQQHCRFNTEYKHKYCHYLYLVSMMKTFDSVCGIYMDLPRTLLTTGGSISVISLGIIFILFYYYKIPNLRRHPTSKSLISPNNWSKFDCLNWNPFLQR